MKELNKAQVLPWSEKNILLFIYLLHNVFSSARRTLYLLAWSDPIIKNPKLMYALHILPLQIFPHLFSLSMLDSLSGIGSNFQVLLILLGAAMND